MHVVFVSHRKTKNARMKYVIIFTGGQQVVFNGFPVSQVWSFTDWKRQIRFYIHSSILASVKLPHTNVVDQHRALVCIFRHMYHSDERNRFCLKTPIDDKSILRGNFMFFLSVSLSSVDSQKVTNNKNVVTGNIVHDRNAFIESSNWIHARFACHDDKSN